ncbi:Transport and Golgi organisation 2 [Propionivibrio dicarboxylicus]|uniref:Transport and Golgi organisation 2 n=2 Tax=Propionivibrio dicarboxylicus TaxID=83767 RepID=A0A1G8D0T0_9RHOO|nr:Transport and Golgi organisation 2 [Propionivibrio dicarboxylicus]
MLTADFLTGSLGLDEYLTHIGVRATAFNGFNLLLGDGKRLAYLSNRAPGQVVPRFLEAGIYGLSNHVLDTPWPKLTVAKKAFGKALAELPETSAFFDLLADDEIVPDQHLPSTGVPPHWERLLSAIFVRSPDYGTRASTVLCVHHSGRIVFEERQFGPQARKLGHLREDIQSSSMLTGV